MTNKHIEETSHTPLWWCRSATAVLMASLLLGGLSSCSKDVEGEPHTDTLVEILPFAQFSAENIATQPKAPVGGVTEELTFYFSRADETAMGTYGTWGTTAFSGTRASGAGATAITFATTQYYMLGKDPLKTKITGWYPGGAAAGNEGYYDGSSIEWTFDGGLDIMTCAAQEGSRVSAMPAFEFKHQLTQTIFCPYAPTQEIADIWGKIIKIEVLGQMNTCTYDVGSSATGQVGFSNPDQTFEVGGIAAEGVALSVCTEANKESNAAQMGHSMMMQPQASTNYGLPLRITTEKRGGVNVTVPGALTESSSHKIFLQFTAENIFTTDPTIVVWQDALYTQTGDDFEF